MPRGTSSSGSRGKNGPEPSDGSWVYAGNSCPSRYLWQRRGPVWVDEHGCRALWEQLDDPVDALPPEGAP